MTAFAANSILCRKALGEAAIDPAGFTTLRLASGAFVLWLLIIFGAIKRDDRRRSSGSWVSAAMLFLYAVAFSFAFVRLQAGTGALILFGAVQATMILTACYDPITSFQIFPWHHAAGDFVVRLEEKGVTVRLITVRDYVPLVDWAAEPDDERSLLDALVVFFLHLSIRMRLDRLDGVKEVAWASDRCLAPIIDGFFMGLDLTARMSGFPESFPETFRHYFNHHDGADMLAMARRTIMSFFDRKTEERRLTDCHLTSHVQGIRRLLAS
jgi:hypothetical protein